MRAIKLSTIFGVFVQSAIAFTILTADVAIAQPQLIVEVYDDNVFVYWWPPDSTITLTIDDPSTAGIDFTKEQTGPTDTGMLIKFLGEYDVKPEDIVRVTDGTTTLTHEVRHLAITVLDPIQDRVEGTAVPGSTLSLSVGGPETGYLPFVTNVTADGNGDWVFDFPPEYDLLPGAWTSAIQAGPDDQCKTSFSLNPSINVNLSAGPDSDYVHTWGWLGGVELTLTIDDLSTAGVDFETHADYPLGGGGFGFVMGSFEIKRGFVVTITDGTSEVVHHVRQIYVTQVDVSSSTMSVIGTADPGSLLRVVAWTTCGEESQWVEANDAGDWVAGPFCPGGEGNVWQEDLVSNATNIEWYAPPRIVSVDIDIKPGSDTNPINIDSAGVIPLAVFSSDILDATQIDPATVRLAGASIKSAGRSNKPLVHYEDVNGDGLLDLVCQVLTEELSIESEQSMALFVAMTFDGIIVWGVDSVCIVPDK